MSKKERNVFFYCFFDTWYDSADYYLFPGEIPDDWKVFDEPATVIDLLKMGLFNNAVNRYMEILGTNDSKKAEVVVSLIKNDIEYFKNLHK